MKIETSYWAKPGPDRQFDWDAVDADTYDGAPDSKTRSQIGYGPTEADAVRDLYDLLDICPDCSGYGLIYVNGYGFEHCHCKTENES